MPAMPSAIARSAPIRTWWGDWAGQSRDGLAAGGIVPAIKHLPGHGRASRRQPRGAAACRRVARGVLRASDFVPFRALCDTPAGLTAHVCYEALDPERPGTLSRTVIEEAVRGAIGFDGLLVSDDLSMGP